jgi:hypothetical protein
MRGAFAVVIAFGLNFSNSLAAAEPARQPQGLGQLVVTDPQSGSPVRLNLARYHVNVVLHPPVALVQIDQSFYNPFNTQQEGTFVFNLPAGASVSRFAMYTTHTELVEGELIDRGRAANIYQSIVNRRRDPAILEQIGDNLFKMRVFPIFGRDTKRILLDFTLPIMEQEGGNYTFELPLMSDLEPVWDFAVTGAIRGPTVAGTARSPSHANLAFDKTENDGLKFEFRKQHYRPESAFVVRFQQKASAEATVRSYADSSPRIDKAADPFQINKFTSLRHCELLATISPQVLDKNDQPRDEKPPPADLLIVADTSGGIADRDQLHRAVQTIVKGLRTDDRFAIGCADVAFRALASGWVATGSPAAQDALAKFDRELFLGESRFDKSLAGAMAFLPVPEAGRRRIVVYVGDGALPPSGRAPSTAERQSIVAALAQAQTRLFAVIQENDPAGRYLFEQLAAASGGQVLRIGAAAGSQEELTGWVQSGFAEPIKIAAVKAEGVAPDDLFVPTAWAPGRSLQIFGRRKEPGPMKLEVTIERRGKLESHEWTLELKDNPADMFVGRLWAQRKVDQLRTREALADSAAERHSAIAGIVSLSQEWTLLSPHTAFLVLENEGEYPRYGIARQTRHQYWIPADAIPYTPLPKEALVALVATRRAAPVLTEKEFASVLAKARLALTERAPRRALNTLETASKSPLAVASKEFGDLQQSAVKLLSHSDLLRNMGPWRGWFDRERPIGFDVPVSDLVWRLLHGYGAGGRYDDPQLAGLAKHVPPPAGELTLATYADWIAEVSGLSVWLDRTTLSDEGVALDQQVLVTGIRSMSLESQLKHVLGTIQLTHVFENGVLKITTSTKAGEKLATRLYPVSDLILSTSTTDHSLLVDADLDRELLSNRRLEEKLDRKVSVDFDRVPLSEALSFLSDKFDDNFIVDQQQLQENKVALNQPVTLRRRDVPLREVLALLCEPIQLATTIENEAVVLTTSTQAGQTMQTRLYSAQGIVYDMPPELEKNRRQLWPGRGGMGGLMGGGMGGGMGGMGGGMIGGSMMGGFGGGEGGGGFGFAGSNGFVGTSGTGSGTAPSLSESAADGDRAQALPLEPTNPVLAAPSGFAKDDELNVNALPMVDSVPANNTFRNAPTPQTAVATMNLISTTVQPDSWEDLSGPGNMMYYRGALSFVVRQTRAVHAEIEELIDRLQEFPPAFGVNSGFVPARIPNVGPDDTDRWDLTSLMNVISTSVQPDSWEDLSGPGSIFPHRPKLILAIRQTQAIHREVHALLTGLRRARYMVRQGRAWKPIDLAQGPAFSTVLGLTDLAVGTRQSELPQPDPDELAALAVLREPLAGTQTWRAASANRREGVATIVRSSFQRREFEFDGRLARVEGDEAMVAYPGLTLVERGNWGEAVRRVVDGRLPWLPHRSRAELARLFKVKVAAQNEETVQLQFGLPGMSDTEILMTVSRNSGLPIKWENRLDGQITMRLRFENLQQDGAASYWKTVVAEDETQRELERWELVSYDGLKSDILPLSEGWKNDLVFNVRDQQLAKAPPAMRILQAVLLRDWKAADAALAMALANQPGQPFLLLIKAWTLSQYEGNHSAEIVETLQRVAASGNGDLLEPLADASFAKLGESAILDILLALPVERRRPRDWDKLAQFAVRTGRAYDAVGHLKAAMQQAGPVEDDFERARLLVELLLKTGHPAEGIALAEERGKLPRVTPEEMAIIAETLHRGAAVAPAANIMRQALARPEATAERRQRLLMRRADLEKGDTRWRTMVEALELLPAESPLRAASADLILAELTSPDLVEQAGLLAQLTKDPRLQTKLLLRQADLYVARSNAVAAAAVGWALFETRQLPADRFDWLLERLRNAGDNERLILLVEDRLRRGAALNQIQIEALATAYDAVGRPDDSLRARSNARDIKP